MLQPMGGKVVPFVPAAGQTVVGQAAGPHDLRPGLIVLRIDVKDRSVFHDRAQEALRQRVRYLHLRTVGEVPFHGMHHDIGAAGAGLIVRQGQRQLRVHDGELRPAKVTIIAPFFILIGDHAAVAHFTAGGGDGQHHAQGEERLGLTGMLIQVLYVIFRLTEGIANGLRRIDDRTAAHRKNEIHIIRLGKRYSFIHHFQLRIWHHAAQRHMEDPRRIQRCLHPGDQPRTDGAAPAVMDQDPAAAKGADQLPDPFLRFMAKYDLRGCIQCKISVHMPPPCS